MSDFALYLITRLDFLHGLFLFGVIISVIFGGLMVACYYATKSEITLEKEAERKKKKDMREATRWIKMTVVSAIVFLVLLAATPTTKSAMVAYCVSHLQNSETVENLNTLMEKVGKEIPQ